MDLSKCSFGGIFLAGDDDVLSESEYLLLLNDVMEIAAGRKKSEDSELHFNEIDQKTAFTCVLCLLLEAAKHDVHPSTLSSVLEDCQMSSQRITTFVNLYLENKEKIQLQMSLIGKNYDHIIDVDWRQDYIVKSNNCEKICEPSYVVSLKTWNTEANSEKDITFGCTLEQLEDLVLKLKDATKCIERNAN